MMSPRVTLLAEKEGADVDGVDRDGAEWVGGAADPNCLSLCLTVAASMTRM